MINIKKLGFNLGLIILLSGLLYGGNIWIDSFGTSSTTGTWDCGIRSDTTTTIYPPYVIRWERYEWAGYGVNVITSLGNLPIIYNGYVYLGQGDGNNRNTPGYVWAWDIATGVTKTGYPLGPLDSSIYLHGGVTIANDKLYTATQHKVYGWDISVTPPVLLTGFPIDITESAGPYELNPEIDLLYWDEKIYFHVGCIYGSECGNTAVAQARIGILYCKNVNNGSEIWRKNIDTYSGQMVQWHGRIYLAERTSQKIQCYDANTGVECANFPVTLVSNHMRAHPIIQDGIIYLGTQTGNFYAIDAITGEIKWVYTVPESGIESTASIWEDKVYFTSHVAYLHAVYKGTGQPVPGFPVDVDPPLLGYNGDGPISTANGVVYVNIASKIVVVDANNGNIIWKSPLPPAHEGGVWTIYNYQSTIIGDDEIIGVYPGYNGFVVYEMPSPTITPTVSISPTNSQTSTITETHTITETVTETVTKTITLTYTMTKTITATITQSLTQTITFTFTITQTHSITPTIMLTPTETPGLSIRIKTNYPNPFEEWTRIVYEVSRESEIEVRIWTISGERVREIRGEGKAGENEIEWDGRNRYGKRVASGIYLYCIEARSGGDRAKAWSKMAVIR